MTGSVAFLTGFPGFLGSALLPRLAVRHDEVACLIQPRFRDLARRRAASLLGPDWGETVSLHVGDITDPDLSLSPGARRDLTARATAVYHLAAVYDLGVARDLAERVNVDGTGHVLSFAADCRDLRRFHYVSTCYVSGRHDGRFTEDDLDVGQSFNNHYEASKFRAEVAVRERLRAGLPATIYRPAIVVGDSETGATQKYDGPYGVLTWLMRHPGVAVLPRLGDPDAYELNLVPSDYVVDAITRLSALERSVGEVYQLADPNPPTVGAVTRRFADATGTRVVTVPAPTRQLKRALETPLARRVVGIEPESLNYFTHPTSYTNARASAHLADADVDAVPPPFHSYADRLVDYVRAHPESTGRLH